MTWGAPTWQALPGTHRQTNFSTMLTCDTCDGKTYGASKAGSLLSCCTKKKPHSSRTVLGAPLPLSMFIHEALISVTFNVPKVTIKISFNIPTYCKVTSTTPLSTPPALTGSVNRVAIAESYVECRLQCCSLSVRKWLPYAHIRGKWSASRDGGFAIITKSSSISADVSKAFLTYP